MKKLFLISSPLLFTLLLASCNKDENDGPGGSNQPVFSCPEDGSPVFVEDSGVVKVDVAAVNPVNTDWSLKTDLDDYSGNGFFVWEGPNSMGNPGNGLLTYKIQINTPGTYRFLWRSYITIGSDQTEHNDSWLRIPDAAHFYGKKNNGHIVYPKGTELPPIPESADQENTTPNGAGADGWFKVYMNTANNWRWQASTSDHDAHNIYAEFTHPGMYTIEISGRSQGHGIDAFLLFQESAYSQNEATDIGFSEVRCD